MSKNGVNETTEMWREVRESEKRVHEQRKIENLKILETVDLKLHCRSDGHIVLIRDERFPAVDFYPGTNRWKVGNKITFGNASALINWLEKRRK